MFTERDIEGVPALLACTTSFEAAARRGTILFYHGLAASKETGTKELASLAEEGFLAVALDNVGHGARRWPDFDARFASSSPDLERTFVEAVGATAAEVPHVVDRLLAEGLALPGGLGIAGISMGGFIAYRALLEEPRISVATPILGSPRWKLADDRSPHLHPDEFYPRAILSQNAGADRSVPPADARAFHEVLARHYDGAPTRQRYVEFAGAGHFMPEDDWSSLWQNVLEWFSRWLRPTAEASG